MSNMLWSQNEEAEMPKRYGNLIEKIVEQENLDRAFDEVVSQIPEHYYIEVETGRRVKRNGRRNRYYQRKDRILARIVRRILKGSFRVSGYREMIVKDGPKLRRVQSPDVEDRIACNAIMRVVEDVLYPSVINTSAASIPGRGMHRLFCKMRRDIDNDRANTRYFYKCDIKKFFESIDQDLMWQYIQTRIKDPILLPMLHGFVTMMPKGLSIGLRSSQCFGNIILNPVDHYFKDDLGVKYYYRYCDDIVIFASCKEKLWLLRDIMHEKVALLNLEIKPNESVKPLTEGVDFLGYVYNGEKARLRKRTKQNAAKKLHKIKSRKRRQEIIGSLKGMAKWGDCKHLYKALTGKKMKDSGSIKAGNRIQDGKKWFEGEEVKAEKLEGEPFVVVDFEKDLTPKIEKDKYDREVRNNGGNTEGIAPPRQKWLVSILHDGKPKKFWTGNNYNKRKLAKAEADGDLPFFTSLEPCNKGRFTSYKFCSAVELGHKMPSDEEVEKLINKYEMR